MSPVAVSNPAVVVDESARAASSAEAELVHAAVAGDAGASRELVRLFHRPIFFYVSRLVGQAQDAEDVTQETFVKAFRALHKVDTTRPLLNWLYTIARRTALNHLRGRRDWTELPPEPVSDGPGLPAALKRSFTGPANACSPPRIFCHEALHNILPSSFGLPDGARGRSDGKESAAKLARPAHGFMFRVCGIFRCC